mgnify:CR=1 FL=1
MHKQAMKELLTVAASHQVPLQHTVALICKCRGEKIGDLASRCGFHRNSLYKALSGEVTPSAELVAGVTGELGVNPWEYRPEKRINPED